MVENAACHKALFDQMPLPRFLVRRTAEGTYIVIEANPKALRYFKKTEEEVAGQTIETLLDQENAHHLVQSFKVCEKKNQPVTIQTLPRFPGDEDIPGLWINPVLEDDGKTIALYDVMGQPGAMNEMALQRERDDALSLLTSIFDVSEVGILVTDHKRHIIKVNDSFVRIYGWSRDDLINKDFIHIITADEQERARRNHEEFLKSGIRSSGEMKLLRKDGGISNVLFTSATLELSQKRRFQVTTIMDITLRKQMELSLRVAKEQADAANHAKSAFLANMSHELRTPLNAIIGFSEMMVKETFGPLGHEKYQEYLEDVNLSAKHLLEIINEVLDMSKIEAGRVELDEKEIDVPGLVDSVTRIMASRAFSSNLQIVEDVQENIPRLTADPRLVRQILINLLTNAVKHSNSGGRIDIKCFVDDDGDMKMIVADTGEGIPTDKLKEAMEPFGQVGDPIHSHGHQGTGLGLPLAKAMAELHQGALKLESELGLGTTVIISFPKHRIVQTAIPATNAGNNSNTGIEIAGSPE